MSSVSLQHSETSIDKNLADLSLNSSPSKVTSTTTKTNNINKLNVLKNVHSNPTISQQNDTVLNMNNNNNTNIPTSQPSTSQFSNLSQASLSTYTDAESTNMNMEPITVQQPSKKSVHAYQYEYFPLPVEQENKYYDDDDKDIHHHKNKTTINNNNNDDDNDPDSGIVQNQDKVINQTVLQQAIKRDMKRKRNDSNIPPIQHGIITTSKTDANNNNSGRTEINSKINNNNDSTESKPMSATARMMLKLYGDQTQQVRENTSKNDEIKNHNFVSKTSETMALNNISNSNNYKDSNRSIVKLPEMKKLKTPSDKIKLTSMNHMNNNNTASASVDTNTFYKNKIKPKYMGSNTSLSSTYSDNIHDFDDEYVEVILKWRDHFHNMANSKLSIISKDITSTLNTLHSNHFVSSKNSENNHLEMLYDYKSKEWFVQDLFLPPGIYKLQFLVNGTLTHSNFLPTATNTNGNIVNWFEVLPGYKTIEPFRDEDKIKQNIPSSIDNNDSDNDSYGKNKSSTSLTDYAGISRTSSIINKNSASTLKLTSLYGFTNLNDQKNKIDYSNGIPEIFKFDANDENDPNVKNNNENSNFDLTLSKVIDTNQDSLFANIQKVAKMNTEEAEEYFLNKFKVPDLPVYLNSSYLNKNFNSQVNHIIPHVNLKHLLTTSIKDDIICVGCTTRYEGKFITQVIYAPCNYD